MTLPPEARRNDARIRLEFLISSLPEHARQPYGDAWQTRLEGLLAVDLDAAEAYVAQLQREAGPLRRQLALSNPYNLQIVRKGLAFFVYAPLFFIIPFVVAQAATEIRGGPPEPLTLAVAVGWETCAPMVLLAMAFTMALRPPRRTVILYALLAVAMALLGQVAGLVIPLWALIFSAITVIWSVFHPLPTLAVP